MVSSGDLGLGLGWGCLVVAGVRPDLRGLQLLSLLGLGTRSRGCGLGDELKTLAGGLHVCLYLWHTEGLVPRVTTWTLPQVGDFAILLRAGFDRWSAAKLQLSTALGGLLGACFAICTQSPKGVGTGMAGGGQAGGGQQRGPGRVLPPSHPEGGVGCAQLSGLPVRQASSTAEETVAWILPFTSGGFLYIALVNVLPDLLEEDDPW